MNIKDIIVEDRVRKDMGDLDELTNSIRKYGVIEPLVVSRTNHLVAGERRLRALQRLGVAEIEHARHFIYSDEVEPLRLRAIELEENLRRKELSWQEQVLGKQRLLTLMQSIHGVKGPGQPKVGDADSGFSANKLAAMLGESEATVHTDLQIASAITQFPLLAKSETKARAASQLRILGAVASMTLSAKPEAATERSWELIEDDFRNNTLPNASADLIWTDLPYGGDLDKSHSEAGRNQWVSKFDDSRLSLLNMLESIAVQSYRVLHDDRYAVFCFSFNYYTDLIHKLSDTGFHVHAIPFIWVKPNAKFAAAPHACYPICYEPLLVVWKGTARLIRPGQANIFYAQTPPSTDKLHLTQKPVELVERFLLDMTTEGAIVVDWCAGTGTTGVACHRLKRRSILYEKDASMAVLARARLEAL